MGEGLKRTGGNRKRPGEDGKDLEETERERGGEEMRSGGRGAMRMKLHRYAPSAEVTNYKPFTNKACS